MPAVSLTEKLSQVTAHWHPHVVAAYNGNDIMVVKVEGDFTWHSHPDTDDFFMVLKGRILIDLPDETVTLEAGELFVVPAGVEHRPRAPHGEAHLLIIEPAGTPNTGDPDTAVSKPAI